MKYISEFRDINLARAILKLIAKKAQIMKYVNLMEVCGSHTMAIARYGIRKLLPKNINLISGPGCPVCVTPNVYLDKAIALASLQDVIITTFGDMMRVPGSTSSLEKKRARGGDIRVAYSTIDAIKIAQNNPNKKIIFLGVGFETTAPTVAAAIIHARKINLRNFYVFCAHKTMPRPMEAIVSAKKVKVDGFICPAHVSTIIGSKPYLFLADNYKKACVIAGFEPLDILEAVNLLLDQIIKKQPTVEIQYSRVTTKEGNLKALQLMADVFEECDTEWRGIGIIENSGLKLRKEFYQFDAERNFDIQIKPPLETPGCICGKVMQGLATPLDCSLFGSVCTPEYPVGACMVSSEGSCAAWYKYEKPLFDIED